METFLIVNRDDARRYGDYGTKRAILEIDHGIQKSIGSGRACQAMLKPPPADPFVAHDPSAA